MYNIKNLLSKGNTNSKTIKNDLETYILYLAPGDQNKFKINVCPLATKGCLKACLFTAGRGKFSYVQQSRINKTNFFLEDKENFIIQLTNELEKINNKAIKENKKIAIRLNGTSDLDFFPIIYKYTGKKAFDFSNLVFYDYTKIIGKLEKYSKNLAIGSKYFLTYSFNELTNLDLVKKILDLGHNISIVYKGEILDKLKIGSKNYEILDGDKTDIEMIYNSGKILALKAKGSAKKDNTGFVVNFQDLQNKLNF